MKFMLVIVVLLVIIIFYLINKIEKQKIKIIYLSKQNNKLMRNFNNLEKLNNKLDNFRQAQVKFIPININNASVKYISYIKIAPFDFAPKILDIPKYSDVKIISKILIMDVYWYEIMINNDNSPNYTGWVKDCNIDFIYKHD